MDKKSLVKLALKSRKTKGVSMSANPFPGSTDEPKKGVVKKGTGNKPDRAPFFQKAKTRGA